VKNSLNDTIKIGPIIYQEHIVEDLHDDDNKGLGLYGQIRHKEKVIELDSQLTPEVAFVTRWHETLHGISDLYNLKFKDEQVSILAVVLADVLQDNPKMRQA